MRTSFSARRLDVVVMTLLAIWAAEGHLAAYIDPGSGALIWQALVAGFVGAAFYFRRFFSRLFSRGNRQDPPSGSGH
jgi:membrane associated rhomboid family serine protease